MHLPSPHWLWVQVMGSPYKTVRVNNFNRLHVIASGSTWREIRCLQSNKGGYFQTCIALQGLPAISLFPDPYQTSISSIFREISVCLLIPIVPNIKIITRFLSPIGESACLLKRRIKSLNCMDCQKLWNRFFDFRIGKLMLAAA